MIIRLPSDITSYCMTDLKASLHTGQLFCSTGDGRIFAVQLGSYLYVSLIVNSGFAVTYQYLVRFQHSCQYCTDVIYLQLLTKLLMIAMVS